MNDRLPVRIENNELPYDKYSKLDKKNDNSYGYVSILYLLSLIITLGSIIFLVVVGKR